VLHADRITEQDERSWHGYQTSWLLDSLCVLSHSAACVKLLHYNVQPQALTNGLDSPAGHSHFSCSAKEQCGSHKVAAGTWCKPNHKVVLLEFQRKLHPCSGGCALPRLPKGSAVQLSMQGVDMGKDPSISARILQQTSHTDGQARCAACYGCQHALG